MNAQNTDTGQMELFPFTPVRPSRNATIDERFHAFHCANPHVAQNLMYLAFQLKAAGRSRVGMKLLVEKLRWEYLVKTEHTATEYTINNDFTSRYARLLMQDHNLAGLFETRSLRDEKDCA